MSGYDVLFEPVRIGPVTAPNRFYAVPHATGHGVNQPNGAIALRAMKAEGGWGVVASAMTETGPDAEMGNHPLDRIWDETDLDMHRSQVAAIKAHGALAGIEIAHGGMRARNMTTGLPVIGPSALPVLRPEVPLQARAMDKADIRAFRESHKAAARRAKTAGYDIIYVYAAHDLSLLSHFLSRRYNFRTDEYGGSFENRLRLLREVLEDTLEVAAGDRAVALRFAVAEPDKAVGLAHDGEGRDVVEALAETPDLWDVNLAGWPQDSQTSRFSEEGFQLPFTDFVKQATSKPVVGVGRFTSPDLMVSLVRKGRLDLIGAARPSIADPFLPAKIREGRAEDIRECIGCNICVSMDGYGLPIRCTQNPTIAEEFRRGWHPERVSARGETSVLIVGAGPAGLECALTLARGGCNVTLAEAEAEVGGRVSREARLPGLNAWGRVRDYRLHQLRRMGNVEIFTDSPLTAEDIGEFGADETVIATGARWRADGVGSTNFTPMSFAETPLTPDDVMAGDPGPGRYAVYDDDHFYMASAVAEALAGWGRDVAYVTPLPTVATWTVLTLEQDRIVARLGRMGVALHVNTRMTGDGAFSHTLTGAPVAMAGRLVMVGAREAAGDLATARAARPGVGVIGDALAPGNIQAAVFGGRRAAMEILGDPMAGAAFRRERATLFDD